MKIRGFQCFLLNASKNVNANLSGAPCKNEFLIILLYLFDELSDGQSKVLEWLRYTRERKLNKVYFQYKHKKVITIINYYYNNNYIIYDNLQFIMILKLCNTDEKMLVTTHF